MVRLWSACGPPVVRLWSACWFAVARRSRAPLAFERSRLCRILFCGEAISSARRSRRLRSRLVCRPLRNARRIRTSIRSRDWECQQAVVGPLQGSGQQFEMPPAPASSMESAINW